MTEPTDQDRKALAKAIRAAGVRSGHAYDIASGRRNPSDALAARLFMDARIKVGRLAPLSDRQARALIEAWGLKEAA